MNYEKAAAAAAAVATATDSRNFGDAATAAAVSSAPKAEIEQKYISIEIPVRYFTLDIQKMLDHTCAFKLEKKGEKIGGFHYYGDRTYTLEHYDDWTAVIFSPELSVWTKDSIYNFHKGWVKYKDTLYSQMRSFFPSEWQREDIENHLRALNIFELDEEMDFSRYKIIGRLSGSKNNTIKNSTLIPVVFKLRAKERAAGAMKFITLYPLLGETRELLSEYKELQALFLALILKSNTSAQQRAVSSEAAHEKNAKGATLQDELLSCPSVERLQQLIDQGVDINSIDSCERTALMLAAKAELSEHVALLLQAGADVSKVDSFGKAAAHYAMNIADVNVAILLFITETADLKDKEGVTPLMLALSEGRTEIVEFLLNAFDAQVNISTKRGKTPLMYAAQLKGEKSSALIRLLLERGAYINSVDANNETALHYAVHADNVEGAVELLKGKADYTSKDSRKQLTPLELARHNHCFKLAEHMQETIEALSVNSAE